MDHSYARYLDALTPIVPDRVKAAARPLYLRLLGRRADRQHESVASGTGSQGRYRHVLFLVVDAFRLDTIPDLPFDWSAAVAPSTWTFPSVTSMHTGRDPHEHGAVARTAPDDDTYAMPAQTESPVIPLAFERLGFDTYAGFAFLTPFLAVRSWYQHHRVFPDVRAERVLRHYRGWRSDRDRTFGYLHLGDLHAPLDPPATYIESHGVDTTLPNLPLLAEYTQSFDDSDECRYYRDQRFALYRAAVDYLADQLEDLLLPLRDDTLIVLTGDHGEAHWEHVEVDRLMTDSRPNYGVGHGGTPLDPVARVPVAISTPDGGLAIRGGTPSLCDVPRTLLDLNGESPPSDVPGTSWVEAIPDDRVAVCEAPRYGVERKAAYRGREKVIESKADGVVLGATVDEMAVGDRFGTVSAETIDELRREFVWDGPHRTAETGRYVREQLEALGYQ